MTPQMLSIIQLQFDGETRARAIGATLAATAAVAYKASHPNRQETLPWLPFARRS
jgi:hypothetical protein